MVRHHGRRARRGVIARHHGDGRNGDQYMFDPFPRGVGPKAQSKANYDGRTPTSRPPKASKKNSTTGTSSGSGRDQPPMDDGAFGDSAPHPREAANELRDIGTESFTNYDASTASYDDASSYMDGGKVVSTMSHMASPDFNKPRGLTSKTGKNGRGHHSRRGHSYGAHGRGGGGRMPRLNEDASASFIEDDESAYGGTNYTGYSAYSRGGYSSVLPKDTDITDYSSVLCKDTGSTGYTSVGTGLTEDYTRDDDTGYDTAYDSHFTADMYSAYTDDRTNPSTNHLMREVKKEMKEMRRDWREEKRDMENMQRDWRKEKRDIEDIFEGVECCDFSVLQKQIDKLVSKGKVSLIAMINDKLNMGTESKSSRGRGARRREAWDKHLKNLDLSQIVKNESDLVSSASFTPSHGVVVDFDDNDGEAKAAALESTKEDGTALNSGFSCDEPSRLDNQPAPRPPTPPACHHNTEAVEDTMSPKHTTPESHVMIKGGQMSVINPSADENGDYISSTKAALRKVGSGVKYFFHSDGASNADESVEVEARDKGTVVDGTKLIANEQKNHSPNTHLTKYANPSNNSVGNETSTTTVTLIKPSPSTSSLLKAEANINGPVYQGPASGLPNETQQLPNETNPTANALPQSSLTNGAKNDDSSTCDSSESGGRRMKVVKSSNGLRKGKQAAGRPKKTVTEWLAGIQYEECKPTGTKWVKSKNAKNAYGSKTPRVPPNGAGMGRSVSIKRSTRKSGLKKDDDNVSVELSVEDRGESSVFVV